MPGHKNFAQVLRIVAKKNENAQGDRATQNSAPRGILREYYSHNCISRRVLRPDGLYRGAPDRRKQSRAVRLRQKADDRDFASAIFVKLRFAHGTCAQDYGNCCEIRVTMCLDTRGESLRGHGRVSEAVRNEMFTLSSKESTW